VRDLLRRSSLRCGTNPRVLIPNNQNKKGLVSKTLLFSGE